ncbi:putative bifunctional diguanylate cyclase/phosphodiesterase [Pseudomonadota bacterium]|uniref:putative bifunctional diguanylate cyclase/phosphodiesterase n=1 Tax=unclassified Shewanella TaxID=196818 RepID=UPI000CCAA1FC|nr:MULTISPECIES: EAL domain-containing protein [unclassified Shewanella]MDO6619814.1 EAL domain-containing protein [Shewanella sp. 6_MG-2023]MDO6638949.1 EAL domain-containing protein [Shewanella sp. 5_MG-2023]MDO6676972.1 EAL domain-containing protein [Shewanella sp. 4_MG-2023]MDO6774023.1 EAL domain-containing protein [Shewanella sp. 3_MG-2023]PMG27617.1 diguanylate phosphodiesterase [Shewanella sp. 10N.286.52.C2]
MTKISKFVFMLISFLMMMNVLLVLSFSQGIDAIHTENFHHNVIKIAPANVIDTNSNWEKWLFLENDIVKSGQHYFAVLARDDNELTVVKVTDVFGAMMMFSNVPLLLMFLFACFIPFYIKASSDKKNSASLEFISNETDKLLATFKIKQPNNHTNNTLSHISVALNELNRHVKQQNIDTQLTIFQDKLTGLVDRHAYLEHLEKQLQRAQKDGTKQALLFIDLDGFKQVNDSFGHSFGDEVLIQVANRLSTVIRNHDLSYIGSGVNLELNLSRLGGDEFSIFIDHIDDDNRAVEVAKNVLQEVERDFVLGNKIIKIGASIGIASYPDSASNPNTLLQMADVAMYRAKADGRGIFRVYSPEMGNKIRRYHYLLEEMRLAIASQNFSLSFQPIVSVDDCSIDYFECLVRWNHPIEGPITPTEFIPIAEDSNLIIELGNWILFEACRQMSAWHNAGMNKVRISVNISGVQLKHVPLYDWIMDTLAKTGLPARALLLEITESCLIHASDTIINDLQKLRRQGVLIAIDDFGTGFSSLSTLANLPVDVIKIDKLFIDQATINPKYEKILDSISNLGKTLDLKVVAEGVEVASQFELIKKLGIHCVQGYLISRPETSFNVGSKVIKNNLNHIALTGTGVCNPIINKDE